jgi:rSAM/selenodomain-associated transferase 1
MFETAPPPPQRLLVFARVPELGKVKTRLALELGDERTLVVYESMLRGTLQSIGQPTTETEIEIVWAPTPAAGGDMLRRAFGDRTLAMQTGATLGDRLAMAFTERFVFHQTQKIVAIGVDDPHLSRESIDHALALLESVEWVVGPATDGGYYLIGCRALAFDSEIFAGIDWGTDKVFATTLAKIREWASTVAVLPMRSDIDTAEDLERYGLLVSSEP